MAIVLGAAASGCSSYADSVDPVDPGAAVFPVLYRIPAPEAGASHLHTVWARDDGAEFWIGGSGGTILHSRGGVLHRDSVRPQRGTDWRGISFSADGSVGLAVGSDGQVADYSTDTDEWIPRSAGTSVTLNSVWVSETGYEAYAVGADGIILRRAGQSWSRVELDPALPRPCRLRSAGAPAAIEPSPYLSDVAGNDTQVWARDSLTGDVFMFTRQQPAFRGILPAFNASRIWSTSNPSTLWRAGVRCPPHKDDEYTIIAGETGEDTIRGVRAIIPLAVAMSRDHKRGIAWGFMSSFGRTDSAFYSYVTRRGSYVWRTPTADTVEAITATAGADSVWVVGRNGLVARFDMKPLAVREITWNRSFGRLSGQYRLTFSPRSPPRTLDSLVLAGGNAASTLRPARDYTVVSNRGDTLEFEFTDNARTLAKQLYLDRTVSLRLFVGYHPWTPAYTVAFAKHDSFVVGETSLLKTIRRSIGKIPYVVWLGLLVILAIFSTRLLRLAYDPDSGLGTISRPLNVLVKFVRPIRTRVFRPYLQGLRKELPDQDLACTVHVVGRGRIPEGRLASGTSTLPELHAATPGGGVLWIEDAALQHERRAREALARLALAARRIPVLVTLDEGASLPDEIAGEWERLGQLRLNAESLLKGGGHTVLIECASGSQPDAESFAFIRANSGSNLFVVCSSAPPPLHRHFPHVTLS